MARDRKTFPWKPERIWDNISSNDKKIYELLNIEEYRVIDSWRHVLKGETLKSAELIETSGVELEGDNLWTISTSKFVVRVN